MGKLDSSFPGFAALDAAGEATEAKVRKRIAAGTLTEIEGIGQSTADKITEEFEANDSPSNQADDVAENPEDEVSPEERAAAVANPDRDGSGRPSEGVSTEHGAFKPSGAVGGVDVRSGAAEAEAQAEATNPGLKRAKDETLGGMLANSRLCFYDDPAGPYISQDERIEGNPRIKVMPISMTIPQKGWEVYDGDDNYTITEEMQGENPGDWLKVRSPKTGLALIR